MTNHDIATVGELESMMIGKCPALFTDCRVTRSSIPKGYHAYAIRHDEKGDFVTVENSVAVNFAGTIITQEPLDIPESGIILADFGDDSGTPWGFVNNFSEFGDSFSYNPTSGYWTYIKKE